VLTFYQEPIKQNYHFCYINCNKNYLINQIDLLLKGKQVTMFLNNEKFVIHKLDEPCGVSDTNIGNTGSSVLSSQNNVITFIKETYPKQKYLPLAFAILEKHNLFDTNLFCIPYPNLHIADICSFFLNGFGKTDKTDARYIKFCKFLQKKGVKLPKISIKNPVAQKYLT